MKTTDKVREELNEHGFELLSDYKGQKEDIRVRCPKGHESSKKWATLRKALRAGRYGCRTCHNESMAVKNPNFKGKTREEHRAQMDATVKAAIKFEGYAVDERTTYKNNQTEYRVTCPEGHEFLTNWNRWQNGKRCRKCFEARLWKSFEDVAAELEASGCQLIAYHGATEKMLYICECGNKHEQLIGSFRDGHRCPLCAAEKAKRTYRRNLIERMEQLYGETVAK